ncbi:MAG: hypothetical protein U5K43_10470 [Halofilum sp. (in: g-proteobacteria)]|nr:hypothetical protein [Halofilum sp. (in: g-proteobacteria)]
MTRLKQLTSVLKGGVLALALGGAAPAGAADTFPVLLCPHGCGPNAGDTILMNQMIQSGTPAVLYPQETPGYLANIRMMKDESRWDEFVFGTEDTVIQLARRGGEEWFDEFMKEPVNINFKLLYGEAWWAQGRFFVTYDPEIQTVEDMKGKKVAVGLRSQSDWGFNARLFLKYAYGVTPEEHGDRPRHAGHADPAADRRQRRRDRDRVRGRAAPEGVAGRRPAAPARGRG